MEKLFNRLAEIARDLEREQDGGHVITLLYRNDGLARDANAPREFLLRDAAPLARCMHRARHGLGHAPMISGQIRMSSRFYIGLWKELVVHAMLKHMSAYWLMKTEPETFSIDDLKRVKKEPWTGVRNYQARNHMRAMHKGDIVLFYHSSCAVPGIYGLGKVASLPYPDPTQFDTKSDYYDAKATEGKPIWYLVDVAFVKKFKTPVTLAVMRANPNLKTMVTLQPGSRLSVTPMTTQEFAEIHKTTMD